MRTNSRLRIRAALLARGLNQLAELRAAPHAPAVRSYVKSQARGSPEHLVLAPIDVGGRGMGVPGRGKSVRWCDDRRSTDYRVRAVKPAETKIRESMPKTPDRASVPQARIGLR